jgi:CBS domain-containing protein
MTRGARQPGGSYWTPAYEHASAGDAMRPGLIVCLPETPLRTVAQMMAREHIHCIFVTADDSWSVVSDADLLRAAGEDLDLVTAGEVATSDVPTVLAAEPLERAAGLMTERQVSHVLVLEPDSRRPLGVLSTLDVAGILAWGRG